MRLWHSRLIPLLDGKRLCDLHMSCCNLRGKGWGKRNAAVGYLYEDPAGENALYAYHRKVLDEMTERGYKPDENWFNPQYCGKSRHVRAIDFAQLEEVFRRNVPLQGHTVEILFNDIKALRERGANIEINCRPESDELGIYVLCRLLHPGYREIIFADEYDERYLKGV